MAQLGVIWADGIWDTSVWNTAIWAQTAGPGDTTAPTLSSATINTSGTTLTLTFSEAVTFGAGGNTGFVATMTGGASALTYASGSGTSSLVYNFARTIQSGETGTLAYTQPSNGVEDSSGNDFVSISGVSVTNNSTADTVVPTLSNAAIIAATTLRLTFSEVVSVGAGGNGGWAVTLSGGAATVSYASGSGTNQLIYTISRSVAVGETGTTAYTQPGNGIEDAAGNDLATIASASITNLLTSGNVASISSRLHIGMGIFI